MRHDDKMYDSKDVSKQNAKEGKLILNVDMEKLKKKNPITLFTHKRKS